MLRERRCYEMGIGVGMQRFLEESTEGKSSKFETSLARTVARRTEGDEKRAERAKEGRGKGWKKRERSEKQARIERGISGFVDKWRKE